MSDEPLSPRERDTFAALPREMPVPSGVEDRVIESLRRERRSPRAGSGSRWWQLAAAVVLVSIGFAAGRAGHAESPADQPGRRYLLLLYGSTTSAPAEEEARVAEYAAWARTTLAERLVAAEKLTDTRLILGPDAPVPEPAREPNGFFLVRAADRAEAERLAATCPHLRHGGTVVVRDIDEVP
jgi:hypothetical protein